MVNGTLSCPNAVFGHGVVCGGQTYPIPSRQSCEVWCHSGDRNEPFFIS